MNSICPVGSISVRVSNAGVVLSWAVKAAGRAKVVMSGGPKTPTDDAFLSQVRGVMEAGGAGLAVGRNVWQHPEPLKMAQLMRQVVFENLQISPASKLSA